MCIAVALKFNNPNIFELNFGFNVPFKNCVEVVEDFGDVLVGIVEERV